MTDQRDTPDTRTPSAEALTLTPFGKVVAALLRSELNGYDREATADEVLAALSPGQGSDAPSAPNRAPTDEARCTCGHRWKMHTYDGCHHLIDLTPPTRCPCPEDRPTADRDALMRRLDSYATVLGVQPGKGGEGALVEEARAALEDLTRENESLRDRVAHIAEDPDDRCAYEVGDGSKCLYNDGHDRHLVERNGSRYATVPVWEEWLAVFRERDDLRRQVAAAEETR
jgi:hypothetical protein